MLTTPTPINGLAQKFPDDKFLQQLDLRQLDWVKASGNYLFLQVNGRRHIHKISLCKLEEILPTDRFARIHKSCLVQVSKIDKVELTKNEVIIAGHALPLGRTYRERLLSLLPILG